MTKFRARSGRDIIVEYIQQGAYIKVSAIDARTGFEVSIVGDAKQSQESLQVTAVRKLEYVLEKRQKKRKMLMQGKIKNSKSTSGWDI